MPQAELRTSSRSRTTPLTLDLPSLQASQVLMLHKLLATRMPLVQCNMMRIEKRAEQHPLGMQGPRASP